MNAVVAHVHEWRQTEDRRGSRSRSSILYNLFFQFFLLLSLYRASTKNANTDLAPLLKSRIHMFHIYFVWLSSLARR